MPVPEEIINNMLKKDMQDSLQHVSNLPKFSNTLYEGFKIKSEMVRQKNEMRKLIEKSNL
jgi:hypothetical protein